MNIKWIAIAAMAAASLTGQTKLTAEVPFAFDVKGQHMEAGTYSVQAATNLTHVRLQNERTGKAVLLITGVKSVNGTKENALEFKRYGGVYFFTAIRSTAAGLKMNLPDSKREREMASTMTPEVIVARAR